MSSKMQMPPPERALPGRPDTLRVSAKHHVNGNRMVLPFPEGLQMAMFGMGCFWGAERKFWRQKGVYSTQMGYSGGYTPNPTYEEVCTGACVNKGLRTAVMAAMCNAETTSTNDHTFGSVSTLKQQQNIWFMVLVPSVWKVL
ncbi:mitochondrial peptide methionine sulfoxide reductase isoform X2 [Pygocentrus nattereri]|uniref:mitochondrial peptide methionine sulfoxide reductase isoform X2 n=1 Tax=Pygocentrus nattereri TaxID=42514 RepID=UPI000814516D|nr:mitochondrial peptide methionine sulfoxide reductase isoform X2 [Pygocentrus nattereri]